MSSIDTSDARYLSLLHVATGLAWRVSPGLPRYFRALEILACSPAAASPASPDNGVQLHHTIPT